MQFYFFPKARHSNVKKQIMTLQRPLWMIPDCCLSSNQRPWSLFQKSIDLLAWWRFHLDAAVTLTVITLRVWSSWLSTCRCIGKCVSVLCVSSVCVWANYEPFFLLSPLSHSLSQYLFGKEQGHRCGNRRGQLRASEFKIILLRWS